MAMRDYEELVETLRELAEEPDDACAEAADAIEALQAADVRPVVRGKWIDRGRGFEETDSREYVNINIYECSCCSSWQAGKTNYCPKCGAFMSAEEDSDASL